MWKSVTVTHSLSVQLYCLLRWSVSVFTSQGGSKGSGGATCTIAYTVCVGHSASRTVRVGETVD